MRHIFMNALPLLGALIGMCTLGACPASADNQTYPNIPQNPNAAAMQATCTGYTALQFTATGLAASTSYTAVVTITAECPGSTTPTTHIVNVNFSTPATVTGLPGGPAFRNTDYIQVGNTNCVQVTINPNTYCEDNPGLPVNNPSVQNYSTGPDGGINGPLSLNPQDTSTNNGCAVTATITLTATPSSAAATVVNMEGNFAPIIIPRMWCAPASSPKSARLAPSRS